MFRGTIHVIVGSGLTIAGAVACLSFTRLPYFQSLGVPAAIGVLVALAAALTLGPAVLVMASHFGLMEPKRATRTRGWRRIGTVIVRWPGPILVASIALALIGLLALPGYKTSYDARPYLPASAPAVVGYAAAERHFSEARLNPELLMIESDHDMRNPADMILLERVAKAVLHTPGIALVQSITRPLGTPISHSSIPFQISATSASTIMNLSYQQARAQDILKQVDQTSKSIDILQQQLALQQASAAATDEQTKAFHDTVDTINQVRDNLANFDDFFRPLRNYFYWEPHCFDIPSCAAIEIGVRLPRRHQRARRQVRDDHGEFGQTQRPAAAARRPDPTPARRSGSQPRPAALELRHHGRHRCAVRGGTQDRDRARQGLRRRQERRLLLPAAGSLRQPGLQAWPETVHVTGRPRRPHDHHPRRQSRDTGGDLAHRRAQELGVRCTQGHPVGGRQGLHRRNRGDLQGHCRTAPPTT